jgi:hypothetical protein
MSKLTNELLPKACIGFNNENESSILIYIYSRIRDFINDNTITR